DQNIINIKRKACAMSSLTSFDTEKKIFQPTEEQMERFTNAFISRLPKYMQEAISPSLAA
ncbi:hypothetical protein G8B25_09200, partial [Lactobacillus delbrueckii]|uniref:hypothetical protein n=1 Tax=Lactobacillus delbrueckii TaxID=1584 RepID=UPI00205970E5